VTNLIWRIAVAADVVSRPPTRSAKRRDERETMLHATSVCDRERRRMGGRSCGALLIACLGALYFLGGATAQKGQDATLVHAMHESMMRMHAQIDAAETNGNPDRDFASMMIPHHQGAIDMAKAELLYGKDPVIRRLAQEIMVDQQSEIDAMKLWLGKMAASPRKDK
jgi:hypothetical protein